MENGQRKSRFVTALGWFAASIGAISLPFRMLGFLAVAAYPEGLQARLPEFSHPLHLFVLEHPVLMAALGLFASALLLIVGIGLIRRSEWVLRAGAVLLVLGGMRQASSLVVALSGSIPAVAGIDPEATKVLFWGVIAVNVVSLSWLVFLVWYFRRPSIQSEFTVQGVGPNSPMQPDRPAAGR